MRPRKTRGTHCVPTIKPALITFLFAKWRERVDDDFIHGPRIFFFFSSLFLFKGEGREKKKNGEGQRVI